ncbi:MAG TPA: hypothetical protein VMM60_02150 [Ilumatobacter sp.]|nr:hypothetical protein [Ilumatobacter sp.]
MHRLGNPLPEKHLLLCTQHAPQNVAARLARIREPHVAALNEWAEATRTSRLIPAGSGPTIPWFDPESGGVNATMLFLLQDPSAVASGNRFISAHNCDATARNVSAACAEVGIEYAERCHWNVYPWWVNTDGSDQTRPKMSLQSAAPAAAALMPGLLDLFPNLAVIIVAGVGTIKGFTLAEENGLQVPPSVAIVELGSFSALGGYSRHRNRLIARLAHAHSVARLPPEQRRAAIDRHWTRQEGV